MEQKTEQQTPRTPRTINKSEPPANFSFMSLENPTDLENETPRGDMGPKPLEVVIKKAENEDEKDEVKYSTKCVKLNNNMLNDVSNLVSVVDKMILEPLSISWIDLSYNGLTKIDPVFCDFPNLKMLYLHSNSIADIAEVDKLVGLPALQKLTLHGNPIENTKNYKWYVLGKVPHLKCLDMSGVTKQDRKTAEIIAKNNPQRKKKRKQADN